MKKWLTALLTAVMLTACGTQTTPETHHILCPTGAPALAFLSVYQEVAENGAFTLTEGSDQLVAELSKNDSEYDVIVAPVNLGAQLIAKDKTAYRLAGIVTWGNLYIVGTEGALDGEGEIELFGEGAVPAKVYEASQLETSLTPRYVSEASLVSADLASGQTQCGMLAEPLATATIAKAKQQGITLQVLADLQECYQKATGSDTYGYPQAAVFVKEGTDASELFSRVDAFTKDMSGAETYLNEIGTDTLGLPDAQVVINSLERQNVRYSAAADCKDEIKTFLKSFAIDFTDDFLYE